MTIAQLLRSRTVWFSMLLAALSVAQGFVGLIVAGPKTQMAVGVFIAMMIVLLRVMTTQPLSEK